MLETAALVALGVLLIAASLNDVFQSVIVPRAVGRRLRPSYYSTRVLWIIWPKLANRIYVSNDDPREDFLAVFAPTILILNLMFWSFLLLLGYASIFYGLRNDVHPVLTSPLDAFYFAGASFFTIGFGDFAGTTGFTRLLSVAAGASGFGVISATTAYLFAIFGAFQMREQFVVTIGARAGSPPSGLGLLSIAGLTAMADDLPTVMRSAQPWCASLLETHLAYPVLAYFRSSHDYESWVGTLGTLLDAAVLMITTIECSAGEARIVYNLGRHATHDLTHYFNLAPKTEDDPRITIEQFDEARSRLADAGFSLVDREAAWNRFARLRASYANHLNMLAAYFDVPRLQWMGRDDSLIQSQHVREQIDPKVLQRIDNQ